MPKEFDNDYEIKHYTSIISSLVLIIASIIPTAFYIHDNSDTGALVSMCVFWPLTVILITYLIIKKSKK